MIKKHREDLIKKTKPGTAINVDVASFIQLLSENLNALSIFTGAYTNGNGNPCQFCIL